MYSLAIRMAAGQTEAETRNGPSSFRPRKLYTSVEAPGLAKITGVYLGDDPENQLLMEADCWWYSIRWVERERNEFEKKHKLEKMSIDEKQRWLDDNDLSYPDVAPFDLPVLKKGGTLKITGEFSVDVSISLIGSVA